MEREQLQQEIAKAKEDFLGAKEEWENEETFEGRDLAFKKAHANFEILMILIDEYKNFEKWWGEGDK